MLDPAKYWISPSGSFFDVDDDACQFTIHWNKSLYDDFIMLAEAYYHAAHIVLTGIVQTEDDNRKNDQWFLPGMYMYRQAVELLIKGLLIPCYAKNNDIVVAFTACKHNLKMAFETYIRVLGGLPISEEEERWVVEYLSNMEYVDSQSDLFRYPYRDGYFSKCNSRFLDIVDMANRFGNCYSIIFQCVSAYHDPAKYDVDIDCNLTSQFLCFANHGIGNCMLFDSSWSDGFYAQIEGYSAVADYLFSHRRSNDQWSFFPIAFLIRNAIELSLKRLLWANTNFHVSDCIRTNKKRSHLLYKDLWKSVKPILEYYASERSEDLAQLEYAERYVAEISNIDKNGDVFRYPVNYGLEHRLAERVLDFEQAYSWMQGVFNFLDGCHSMLSAISDYESEMIASYEY